MTTNKEFKDDITLMLNQILGRLQAIHLDLSKANNITTQIKDAERRLDALEARDREREAAAKEAVAKDNPQPDTF